VWSVVCPSGFYRPQVSSAGSVSGSKSSQAMSVCSLNSLYDQLVVLRLLGLDCCKHETTRLHMTDIIDEKPSLSGHHQFLIIIFWALWTQMGFVNETDKASAHLCLFSCPIRQRSSGFQSILTPGNVLLTSPYNADSLSIPN
jgi:hypothetical protein